MPLLPIHTVVHKPAAEYSLYNNKDGTLTRTALLEGYCEQYTNRVHIGWTGEGNYVVVQRDSRGCNGHEHFCTKLKEARHIAREWSKKGDK